MSKMTGLLLTIFTAVLIGMASIEAGSIRWAAEPAAPPPAVVCEKIEGSDDILHCLDYPPGYYCRTTDAQCHGSAR